MFTTAQRARIAIVCLASMALSPVLAREGGGGFRGGGGAGGGGFSGHRPGGAPSGGPSLGGPTGGGGTPHTAPTHPGGAPSVPHPAGGGAPHPGGGGAPHPGGGGAPHPAGGGGPHPGGGGAPHGVGIHGGEPMHGGVGGNHFGGPGHAGPNGHFAGNIHQPGPHWNNYHQAFIGGHPVHLAWSGYRPSYYYHPWYHGPWGGPAWGWGWGFGPGLTFGIAAGVGFGVGIGVGAGWGYPVYYGPYGPYGYWGRPLGWGFGGWGLGTTVYYSGYYPYYNPYYYTPVGYPNAVVVYDYSRPIQVAIQAPPGSATGGLPGAPPPANLYDGSSPTVVSNPADQKPDNPAFDMARDSFKRGDYRAALMDADNAIKRTPGDAVVHEFRSLTLFALGDYRQSAAVAHSLLAVGPGWDYTTMMSLYPDPFVYSEQLQRLESYVEQHPRAADAHFLLAYHDMIGSRKEAALAELRQVVRLMPSDRLANELLTMVKGPKSSDPGPSPGNPPDALPGDPNGGPNGPTGIADSSSPPPDLPAVDKLKLVGSWSASRDDGSKFRLTMTEDGNFNWKYSAPNQKGVDFSGTYSVDGPVLVLQRKEGGALAGTAQLRGDNDLNFKLVGAPPEDNGLDFGRF